MAAGTKVKKSVVVVVWAEYWRRRMRAEKKRKAQRKT